MVAFLGEEKPEKSANARAEGGVLVQHGLHPARVVRRGLLGGVRVAAGDRVGQCRAQYLLRRPADEHAGSENATKTRALDYILDWLKALALQL